MKLFFSFVYNNNKRQFGGSCNVSGIILSDLNEIIYVILTAILNAGCYYFQFLEGKKNEETERLSKLISHMTSE